MTRLDNMHKVAENARKSACKSNFAPTLEEIMNNCTLFNEILLEVELNTHEREASAFILNSIFYSI